MKARAVISNHGEYSALKVYIIGVGAANVEKSS